MKASTKYRFADFFYSSLNDCALCEEKRSFTKLKQKTVTRKVIIMFEVFQGFYGESKVMHLTFQDNGYIKLQYGLTKVPFRFTDMLRHDGKL